LHLVVSALLLVASPGQQGVATPPTDARFYAVAYVEAMASSSPKAIALLKQYRDASAKQDGFVSLELFEQIGRPGHFALFEVWRDQKAFDARDASVQKQLRDALQPLRVSDYDQRPYKTISLDDRRGRLSAAQIVVIAHVDVAPNPAVAGMLKDLAEASRKETAASASTSSSTRCAPTTSRWSKCGAIRRRSMRMRRPPIPGSIATRFSR